MILWGILVLVDWGVAIRMLPPPFQALENKIWQLRGFSVVRCKFCRTMSKPKYQHSVFNLTISELKKYEDTINDLHLINTKKYLSSYFKKMSLEISTNKKQIETHIKINGLLDPIFSFLDRI